ncbi:glucosamine-6-phosphate deaminase [Paenibacillus shenyangensis]|uniref:glucosamine-6-phosphate deaminase n=1 Tax=Paenibacillus sp. A9 TaxID=1284352 RepID=UPI000379C66E|nr:glucosamine-6-phosphate deaminase [Paenibacillus sp. A9]
MVNLVKVSKQEDFGKVAAYIVSSLVQTSPRAVLGLATGGTPVDLYKELINIFNQGVISFSKVKTFNLDEYVGLPADHPASYRAFMNKHLFDHIDIDMDNTHVPNGQAADAAQECSRYDAMLSESVIDLQVLGIGHNGHIGFNEPADQLMPGTHVVDLLPETREANARYFQSVDEVPAQAITMGVGTIMKSRQILLMVRGADKAEIIHRALTGPITTLCPASLLQLHPNVTVLMDGEAGRLFG